MISQLKARKKLNAVLYNNHPMVTVDGVLRFERDNVTNPPGGELNHEALSAVYRGLGNGTLTREDVRHFNRCLGYSESGYFDLEINSTATLIKELGIYVVASADGWSRIKAYFAGISQEEIIKQIGAENSELLSENSIDGMPDN